MTSTNERRTVENIINQRSVTKTAHEERHLVNSLKEAIKSLETATGTKHKDVEHKTIRELSLYVHKLSSKAESVKH